MLKPKVFSVTKVLTICAGHQLNLPYPSKCCNQHGHNYRVAVTVDGPLNEHGMVCDFKLISGVVKILDHKMAEEFIVGNATAENISLWIAINVDLQLNTDNSGMGNKNAKTMKVEVGETDGNLAVWSR